MKSKNDTLDGKIIIRPMSEADIDIIAIDHCPPWSTVQETKNRWLKYYKEQQESIRTVGVVEQDKKILGYGSLFLKSEYPHFSNVPEINDVWIYEHDGYVNLLCSKSTFVSFEHNEILSC